MSKNTLIRNLLETVLTLIDELEVIPQKEVRRLPDKARASMHWSTEELALLKAGREVPGRSKTSVYSKKYSLNMLKKK